MPRPKRPWFRFYVEAIHDPKLVGLSPGLRWLWVVLLAMARQSPIPGYLVLTSDAPTVLPLETSHIASAAHMRAATVREGMEKFEALGMIEKDGELGVWRIPRWHERQFESDDAGERRRKRRTTTGQQPAEESLSPSPENREQRTEETDTDSSSSLFALSAALTEAGVDDDAANFAIEELRLRRKAGESFTSPFAWCRRVAADYDEARTAAHSAQQPKTIQLADGSALQINPDGTREVIESEEAS